MTEHVRTKKAVEEILGFEYPGEPISDQAAAEKVLLDASRAPAPLKAEGYHTALGDVVTLVAPNVQWNPEPLLIQMLVAIGSTLGPDPFIASSARRLKMNNYCMVVGRSGGGKGSSLSWCEHAMKIIDPSFWDERRITSIGSGEGLLKTICDPVYGLNSNGEKVLKDAGSEDKRILYVEEEAGSIYLRAIQSELYAKALTTAWDNGKLMNVVKDSQMSCLNPHVNIVAHITPHEFRERIEASPSLITNGFQNRWLSSIVFPTQVYDENVTPSQVPALNFAIKAIAEGLEAFNAGPREFLLTPDADDLRKTTNRWMLDNEEPGAMGYMNVRFADLCLKTACIYTAIRGDHKVSAEDFMAGRAVAAYSLRCMRAFFGGVLLDDTADDFMALWAESGYAPITMTGISDLFSRHLNHARKKAMVGRLVQDGLVVTEQEKGGGRPATVIKLNPHYTAPTNSW